MTNSMDLPGDALRQQILAEVPNGEKWLQTPHDLLDGKTPEACLSAGDYDVVQDLVDSILHIGIS